MAIYAVGDIQGCFEPLKRLLDLVSFDPAVDKLWCTGDLVNRGPDSLNVLRFVRDLGDSCVSVLGNHDLHLLTLAAGGTVYRRDTLSDVLDAPDSGELLNWLRHRPLVYDDAEWGLLLVHAGLHPAWNVTTALQRANRAEVYLRSKDWADFCLELHHDSYPTSQPDVVSGIKDVLFTVGVMTRVRYCTADGIFDWGNRSGPASAAGHQPWFTFDNSSWWNQRRIIYGHWSAMGLVTDQTHVLGLDSGCVWGGSLSMARLDSEKWPPTVTQCDCPTYQKHD